MAYNYDYSHKMAEAHRQDLLRETEQQRLVTHLHHHRSLSRRVATFQSCGAKHAKLLP